MARKLYDYIFTVSGPTIQRTRVYPTLNAVLDDVRAYHFSIAGKEARAAGQLSRKIMARDMRNRNHGEVTPNWLGARAYTRDMRVLAQTTFRCARVPRMERD